MEITPATKLTDILDAYPGLLDHLIKKEPKFSFLKTRLGKLAIRSATVQDASDKFHISVEDLKKMLDNELKIMSKES